MALRQTPPTWTAVTTGSDEYSVELNDANLETKAWKSSRYDGSQTVTQQLNRYSAGDTTFGKTAAVQKYSKNIYIGNAVVGMDNGGENDLLFNFPAFSYVTTVRYLTVNDDGSVSDNKLESKKTDFDAKRGFYRAFYEDFSIGSDCRIIINDESTKTNLKDRYNVYFNGGQLEKTFSITPTFNIKNFTPYTTSSNNLRFDGFGAGNAMAAQLQFYNQNIINSFYSGSLETLDSTKAKLSDVSYFIDYALDYKNSSNYINDKRFFTSFCTQSGTSTDPSVGNEFESIRTIYTGSISSSLPVLNTENLAELSTTELSSINTNYSNTLILNFNPSFTLNQNYDMSGSYAATQNRIATPPKFDLGTLMFSKLEDATPSLLLNLPKNEHLPDGIGGKSFAIIPENLHPHIKRNLTHFLAKAGISLGVDEIPALDNTFETLK